ncbi:MAG: serine--tRNA ligase, partial [Spirochaetales bacterium]|nr:serine--tRNA ligase [Spirochaetales bacterium]
MLDIRYIKDNLDAVKANVANRCMTADPDLAVRLFDERLEAIQALEDKRRRRNEVAQAMKAKLDADARQALIDEGKRLKDDIAELEARAESVEKQLDVEVRRIPNMAHPAAPVGKEDKDNLEVKRVGEPPAFGFEPKDHVQLGEALDLLDFEAGTKVSGTKFYYLKNEAVFL